MPINRQSAILHIDTVLEKHKKAKYAFDNLEDKDESTQIEILTLLVSAIDRLAPENSHYYKSSHSVLSNLDINDCRAIPVLLGNLRALRTAYKGEFLQELREFVHADIFSDFLEMAQYLVEEGFKDAAAVLIGGVLEEHLRKLCDKHSIPLEVDGHRKKANTMNSDLSNKGVYNKLDHKNITAWLDLRNKAAHAEYNHYTKEQVQLMHQGLREFISRLPA